MQSDLDGPDADSVSTELFRMGAFVRQEMGSNDGLQAHMDATLAIATGSQDIQRDVVIPGAGINVRETSQTNFNMMGASARLTLDGNNGQSWTVKPHLLVAADQYSQSPDTLGSTGVTSLSTGSFNLERTSIGFGATLDHQWSEHSSLSLSATSLHHFGDTATNLVSDFVAPGLGSGLSFDIIGREIEQQYLLQGDINSEFSNGFSVSVQGFAQFGDMEGLGGQIRVSRKF